MRFDPVLYALAKKGCNSGGNTGGGGSSGGDTNALDALIDGSMTEVSSNATTIRYGAFSYCQKLSTANFPVATSIGERAFEVCSELSTANFPVATSVGRFAFQSDAKLRMLDFHLETSIGDFAFYNSALRTLVLRSETVCALGGLNALLNTSLASVGYIYVPAALVDTYKAATNWSNYSMRFRALEDYTVDGTTTGALDESKI